MTTRLIFSALCFVILFSCDNGKKEENPTVYGKFSSVESTIAYFKWKEGAPRLISAHRGGPYPGLPENSIEAFENILKYADAIIECDISVTKDNQLIMMHDDKLDRTTTGRGLVEKKTWEEIKQLKLVDQEGKVTNYSVPTLEEVLLWSKGKAFLTLDIKRGVPVNGVMDLIRKTGTAPNVAIITYNINAAKEVYELNSDLMISVSARNMEDIERIRRSGIALENLIAFTGVYEPDQAVYDTLHKMGIYTILGTIGNLDRRAAARGDDLYSELYERGADILATDRPVEVARQIKKTK